MSDNLEFLPSEKDKQAVKLRSKGHTYEYIARELKYENADAALAAVEAVLRIASVARLSSVDSGYREIDGEFNTIYELKIRITAKGGNPRVPHLVGQLMQALYETEAQWEKEFAPEENAGNIVLEEPTTFSVSKVMVDQAPQTGKHIIFPEV